MDFAAAFYKLSVLGYEAQLPGSAGFPYPGLLQRLDLSQCRAGVY